MEMGGGFWGGDGGVGGDEAKAVEGPGMSRTWSLASCGHTPCLREAGVGRDGSFGGDEAKVVDGKECRGLRDLACCGCTPCLGCHVLV